MKYLPKFKWTHLNERLAYERAVHKQRLRAEVSQAKREANFYKQNVEKSKILKRKEKKKRADAAENSESDTEDTGGFTFKQKDTEEEILAKKQRNDGGKLSLRKKGKRVISKKERVKNKDMKAGLNKSFLKTLFSGGVASESTDS